MISRKTRNRFSKADWLEKTLHVFCQEGEPGVKVETLARRLYVNKPGFYRHFRDRNDLLDQLLDYCDNEYTQVVTRNSISRNLAPGERLPAVIQKTF